MCLCHPHLSQKKEWKASPVVLKLQSHCDFKQKQEQVLSILPPQPTPCPHAAPQGARPWITACGSQERWSKAAGRCLQTISCLWPVLQGGDGYGLGPWFMRSYRLVSPHSPVYMHMRLLQVYISNNHLWRIQRFTLMVTTEMYTCKLDIHKNLCIWLHSTVEREIGSRGWSCTWSDLVLSLTCFAVSVDIASSLTASHTVLLLLWLNAI